MHSKLSEKINKGSFPSYKRLLSLGAIFVALFAVVTTFSKPVHASLSSIISTMMGNSQASAEVRQSAKVSDSQISRTIVLQASGNLNQEASSSEIPPLASYDTLSPEIARMNATTTEPANTQISIYVVRKGDSISGVAKMFNVSVNTVLWANDLNSKSLLQPGQTLVILPVTGITYTIKSKDTLQSIAKKYGADVEDILNYNDLTLASRLRIGDQIIIPDAEVSTPPITTTATKKITKVGYEPLLDGWDYPAYPGYYACPVPGSHVTQELHGHNGIDLGAPRGTPILAAAEGTVIINRSNGAWNGGYGNFVVILHPNGTQTLYAHMSKSKVTAGEKVAKWQIVGYIGMTGLTTGPHIHFEIRGAQNPFGSQALCK